MAKRPTLENVRTQIGDAMVSNLWVIEFTKLPPVLAGQFGRFQEELNVRAVSAEVPKRTGNSLEITIRGHKVKQPGDYDYSGTITLTLIDSDDSAPIHDFIRAWREYIIGTNTGFQYQKKMIEGIVTITRLNRQNQGGILPGTSWELKGVYLEDYELGELTETGDIIQPTITLSYDYFAESDTVVQLDSENGYR